MTAGPVVVASVGVLVRHGRAPKLRKRNRGSNEGFGNGWVFANPYFGQAGAALLGSRATFGEFPALPRGVSSTMSAVDHGVV